jgi:hypothetical protein
MAIIAHLFFLVKDAPQNPVLLIFLRTLSWTRYPDGLVRSSVIGRAESWQNSRIGTILK